MKKWFMGISAMFLAVCVLSGCAQEEVSQDFYAMDTVMNITAYGKNAQDAVNDCVSYINALEAEISRTKESSDVSALNAADGQSVALSDETADVLRRALALAEETDGLFDPTIAPLSDLWQIGTDDAAVPAQEEIDAVLASIDYENITLDGTTASLANGAQIDLGGIGKGYAADQVAQMLRDAGIERAHISLGGNVYVIGEKETGTPWTVGITDPDQSEEYIATLKVTDTSVVTSGDYERYFEQDGVRYCHIFDPETGYPAETDLRSVTVVSEDSTMADAYATALFVMGFDSAWEFCEENDVQAVFILDDHTVRVTGGLADSFTLTSAEYTYEE